jgi:hypothetical protein
VNGRAIAVEHTYTLEDITHVVEDAGVVTPGAPVITFHQSAIERRGIHVEVGPAFVAFAFQQAASGNVGFTATGSSNKVEVAVIGNAPFTIHHGEGFNGAGYSENTGTPQNPNQEFTKATAIGFAPYEYRAIGLFKPVS